MLKLPLQSAVLILRNKLTDCYEYPSYVTMSMYDMLQKIQFINDRLHKTGDSAVQIQVLDLDIVIH